MTPEEAKSAIDALKKDGLGDEALRILQNVSRRQNHS